MPKISKLEAYRKAKNAGISFVEEDSDTQRMSAMTELSKIAKEAGYRKPKNANGSSARYFYYHLLRLKNKRGWS